jgi:asparagine synthetase B (glutamine-hydrolysing)
LDAAVQRRTRGVARLGSQLSGGLDSTTVVAVASSLAERGQGPPVAATFTMSFPDVPETDETGRARDVAERWQVPVTIVNVRPAEILENLGEIFAVHDGPVFPSFISQLKLMEAAAGANLDVIFTGHGGDDWLRQGDQELRLSVMRADWKGITQWGWWQGRWMGNAGRRSVINAVAQGAAGRVRGQRAESWFEQNAMSFWTRHALELTEREGVRRGLRVEFPLHDYEFATLCAGLTPSLRSQPRIAKFILREATRDLLPESVRNYFEWTLLDPVLRAALGDGSDHAVVADEILRRYEAKWRTLAAD